MSVKIGDRVRMQHHYGLGPVGTLKEITHPGEGVTLYPAMETAWILWDGQEITSPEPLHLVGKVTPHLRLLEGGKP